MEDQFRLFAFPHLLFLSLVPLIAACLAWWSKSHPARVRVVRITLGGVLLVNELLWYSYYVWQGWFTFPYSLPLQLCDILVWIAVFAVLTARQRIYEYLYYWGMAGTSLALLTPDLSTATFSYLTVRFFVSHGGIVIAILFLTWSKTLQPKPGSPWRALIGLHLYALAVAIFNQLFNTNFFYLVQKPVESTLLDYMGPWPVYILVGDFLALILFWLLWFPFRRNAGCTPPGGASAAETTKSDPLKSQP